MVQLRRGVASPDDVTPALLSSLLNAHYKPPDGDVDGHGGVESVEGPIKVASVQWTPLGRGVMSDVRLLEVCYGNSGDSDVPTRFLAKFRKEEIPLRDLFLVEGEFYRIAAEIAGEFPFRLAHAVAFGPSWILLEYIPTTNMDIIDVHEGCPSERFDDLLVRLARMHSFCWLSDTADVSSKSTPTISSVLRRYADKLSPSPGAGHTLPPSLRQQQFAPGWPAVRERMAPYFQLEEGTKSLQQLDEIVSWTSQSPRIAEIAQSVAETKCTLVHGDFHIGNMLLEKMQKKEGEETGQTAPWLVDWSMAGAGNPCVDLVFFLVVGAEAIPTHEVLPDASKQPTTEIATERVGLILKQYYRALTASDHTRQPPLQWETFLSMFSECLLNQFVILVCYDDLCRSMADASPAGNTYHAHFDRVNVRCARMLLTKYGMIHSNPNQCSR